MEITSIRTPGLGDATYLFSHHGLGLIVDPQRDINRFLAAAQERQVRIRYVLETHVHNDYVSGGRELAHETGASLILPAGAGVAFDHVPAFHQEEIDGDAGLTIRPIHTPGHTPEHVSYLVLIDGLPVALFSGGSLLVGSAGRPDLLGQARARQLAILQHGSVNRLARLPDQVGLFPTHGEGSFCAASGAGRSTSTIGDEKRDNPVLAYPDAEAFVKGQLAGLGPYPKYYPNMAPINTLGPTPLPARTAPELTPATVADRAPDIWVIDARPRSAFAAGHISGSIGIELADDFGTWVGWVTPFNAPLMLVLDPGQDLEEAVVQLGRIGYDRVVGVLRGLDAWRSEGWPIDAFECVDVDRFAAAIRSGEARQVLDVRTLAEWAAGHIEGAVHRYAPELADSVPPTLTAAENVWVACASGYRSSIAAGLLERAGFAPVVLSSQGVPEVLKQLTAAGAHA
ncbi:MAG: MBL fold metallo-hydrolase [Chloroflexi bacterium]|nr:MBL fold metallo-hydrolase [Chloroflexota bacterium]